MKTKIAMGAFSALAGILGLAAVASASTIMFAPVAVSTTAGAVFDVTVSVDPGGVRSYGVQLDAAFPADIVEATGVTLESGWISPAAPSINNSAGTVSQMAGIGGGFDTKRTLGVIHFKAKKAGTATISVTGSSNVANAQGVNTVAGAQGTSVATVSGGTSTPAPAVTPTVAPSQPNTAMPAAKPAVKSASPTKPQIGTGAATGSSSASTQTENGSTSTAATSATAQAAAVIIGGRAIPTWLLIVAVLVLIGGGVGGYIYRRNVRV